MTDRPISRLSQNAEYGFTCNPTVTHKSLHGPGISVPLHILCIAPGSLHKFLCLVGEISARVSLFPPAPTLLLTALLYGQGESHKLAGQDPRPREGLRLEFAPPKIWRVTREARRRSSFLSEVGSRLLRAGKMDPRDNRDDWRKLS
jgi:hypothetical protein